MNKFLVLFLLVSPLLFAKIYKYKDSHGRIHYVDDISKIPNNKIKNAKILNTRFLKTDNKIIDKYRKIIIKKGVCYKNLKAQKDALLSWGAIMVGYGFNEFKVDLSRINSISLVDKKGRPLKGKKRRKVAVILANFFKSFENEWSIVYEEIHFKSSGDRAIDTMRKYVKTVKTSKDNLTLRVKLLEDWAKIIKQNKNADSALIDARLKVISGMYDVPNPDIYKLSKYVDKTIILFEKEFRK